MTWAVYNSTFTMIRINILFLTFGAICTLASLYERDMYFYSQSAGLGLEGPFFEETEAMSERHCTVYCLKQQAHGCVGYQWNSTSHECKVTRDIYVIAANTTLVSGFNICDVKLHGQCYNQTDGFKYFTHTDYPLINGVRYSINAESQVTAGSTYPDWGVRPACSHLNQTESGDCYGAWTLDRSDMGNSQAWIQADLGHVFYIAIVATQGRSDTDQWVKKYTLSYTLDIAFTPYTKNGVVREFDGNTDRDTVVKNEILEPFSARRVRLHPTDYQLHPSLRWELYGGKANQSYVIIIPQGATFYYKHLPSCC